MNQPDVFGLLAASDPFAEYADKLMLYGQFVGSWDVDVTWHKQGGGDRKGTGEWHFAWILGGCGIQDVLFASRTLPHQFGTTLRCYDTVKDAWHIAWMLPTGGEFVNLLGRRVGDRIVQEGTGSDTRRRERWSFTDITSTSFLWLGEVSFDNGITWFLEQEMRAVRHTTS
jgi:hypothetical protein